MAKSCSMRTFLNYNETRPHHAVLIAFEGGGRGETLYGSYRSAKSSYIYQDQIRIMPACSSYSFFYSYGNPLLLLTFSPHIKYIAIVTEPAIIRIS